MVRTVDSALDQLRRWPPLPRLLFINSIATTRELWSRQVPRLSKSFRVITYDARGHGFSQLTAGDYTIAQLGRDALAILDDAGVESAHVCGISLGGITAMWLGVHAPRAGASSLVAREHRGPHRQRARCGPSASRSCSSGDGDARRPDDAAMVHG